MPKGRKEPIYYYCSEGVNNFVSLDFLLGRFLPTVINRKPSIYNGSWAPPTPGLWNKVEGQRHKIKNTTIAVVHTHISTIFPLNFFLPLLNSV